MNIRPPRDLRNRLEAARERWGRGIKSTNQIVLEILATYLDDWEEMQEAAQERLNVQRHKKGGKAVPPTKKKSGWKVA